MIIYIFFMPILRHTHTYAQHVLGLPCPLALLSFSTFLPAPLSLPPFSLIPFLLFLLHPFYFLFFLSLYPSFSSILNSPHFLPTPILLFLLLTPSSRSLFYAAFPHVFPCLPFSLTYSTFSFFLLFPISILLYFAT